jgi:hypothetical protein
MGELAKNESAGGHLASPNDEAGAGRNGLSEGDFASIGGGAVVTAEMAVFARQSGPQTLTTGRASLVELVK